MLVHVLLASAALAASGSVPTPPPSAVAALDSAIVRMGGAPALRAVRRTRLEMLTQWQRTNFDARPYADLPSYELHSELRDDTMPAWRNARRFYMGGSWRELVDVVRDSVAIRRMPDAAWAPLNVAYVDERRELFAFAPERVLLLARDAADLRALPDTVIGGVAHARVAATVDRYPAVLFLRRGDGDRAMARFVAAHPNDFGLVPWGRMEVELWYSRWAPLPGGINYPMQWDVRRVGRPYKRMTVLAATLDAPAAPDSFTVSDSLRAAFRVTANRPMHDVPLDSARLMGERLAHFGTPGAPAGAVKLGRRWLLLEAGTAPLNAERAAGWLAGADRGTQVAGALVTVPFTGSGGVAWLAPRRIPLHVAPGAASIVRTILRNHDVTPTGTTVTAGRWLRVDGDSLWVEPIDFPNAPGAMLAWVPSLRWVYSGAVTSPVELERLAARTRERRWAVERFGSARA
ncbi:MAG TPA: hypothetical protein VFY16_02075, partial [Gemmatimonadaceae bacterium]|nr:hypothetical protein [Gemmatimonadaceae bacterium]